MFLIIPEGTKKGYRVIKKGECFDWAFPNSTSRGGRLLNKKSHTLVSAGCFLYQYMGNGVIRRFTVRECERLQTLPDGYLDGVISDSQAYKAIGNGWNVATIAHIFKAMPKQDITKITVTSRANWLLGLLRK